MESRKAMWWAIGAGLIALALPIGLAVYLSRQQAIEGEFEHVSAYAHDVLHRTDATAEQVEVAFRHILAEGGGVPCSPQELAVMRRFDLSSSYIQALGRVRGDTLVCSSIDTGSERVSLGTAPHVTRKGARVRFDVRFEMAPQSRFIVIERDGLAAIIHKSLPVDAGTGNEQVALATYVRDPPVLATTRGDIDPAWLARAREDREVRFVDGEHVVAIVPSGRYRTGAIAAIHRTYLDRRARNFAMVMIPIGVLAGGLLVYAIVHLTRVQLRLATLLKSALKRGELFLVYQPVVELATGRWVGAEALLRWRRSNGEFVRPDLFIPAAEEAGIIHLVTRYVLAQVARDLPRIVSARPDFHVAVNLAADDLHAPDTLPLLQALLRDSGLPAEHLHVEATERGFMRTDRAREAVQAIRAAGIRVSIDDFGTGYSSLSYLQSFELDFLKIDKSFVDTIGRGAATSQVVPHIIEMAKSLKLDMVAEGIEQPEQADYLREHGVLFGQGWFYAKPLPLEALLAKL